MIDKLLTTYNFDRKCRYGCNGDGGYVIGVIIDSTSATGAYDCYISAGVSNEESFSRDFLHAHKLMKEDCYAFDGTIVDYPYQYTKNITFIKKNIGEYNTDITTNLHDLIAKYNNIFLKMDIEGGEFEWLKSMDSDKLNKFSQIVIELHWLQTRTPNDILIDFLEKLTNTHYIIHAHGNNGAKIIGKYPEVLELTLVNKKYFPTTPELNKQPFPTSLDRVNDRCKKDYVLDYPPFCF